MRHERKICKLQPFSRLNKQNPSKAEKENIDSGSIVPEKCNYYNYLNQIVSNKAMLECFQTHEFVSVTRT